MCWLLEQITRCSGAGCGFDVPSLFLLIADTTVIGLEFTLGMVLLCVPILEEFLSGFCAAIQTTYFPVRGGLGILFVFFGWEVQVD